MSFVQALKIGWYRAAVIAALKQRHDLTTEDCHMLLTPDTMGKLQELKDNGYSPKEASDWIVHIVHEFARLHLEGRE